MDNAAGGESVTNRIARILRALGAQPSGGVSTSDLARTVEIPRASVHRLLEGLSEEGFVDRAGNTGRWSLGPELYILGSVAAERYDMATIADNVLRALADSSGESVFLSARRGDETVVIAGAEGSFPLRSHVLYPGKRFPLGIASAGLVILAHHNDAEVDEYLDRAQLQERWGEAHSADAVRARLVEIREHGYSVNPGLLVEGSWGLGAAVFDSLGRPSWAVSMTGVETRFQSDRRPRLGGDLLRAAHVLTQRMSHRWQNPH